MPKAAGKKTAAALSESVEEPSTEASETGGDAGAAGGRPSRLRPPLSAEDAAKAAEAAKNAQDLWTLCKDNLEGNHLLSAEQNAHDAEIAATIAEDLAPASKNATKARSAADGARLAVDNWDRTKTRRDQDRLRLAASRATRNESAEAAGTHNRSFGSRNRSTGSRNESAEAAGTHNRSFGSRNESAEAAGTHNRSTGSRNRSFGSRNESGDFEHQLAAAAGSRNRPAAAANTHNEEERFSRHLEARGRTLEHWINNYEYFVTPELEDDLKFLEVGNSGEIEKNKLLTFVVYLKTWNGDLAHGVYTVQESQVMVTVKPTTDRTYLGRFLMNNSIGFCSDREVAHRADRALIVNSPWQMTTLPHYQHVRANVTDLVNASRSVIVHQLLTARNDPEAKRNSSNLNVWLKTRRYNVYFKYKDAGRTKCTGIQLFKDLGHVCRITVGGASNSSMRVNKNGTLDAFVLATFGYEPVRAYNMSNTANLNEIPHFIEATVPGRRDMFINAEHIGALVSEDPVMMRREYWTNLGIGADIVEYMVQNKDALRKAVNTVTDHHRTMLELGLIGEDLIHQVLQQMINKLIDGLPTGSDDFKNWMKTHFEDFQKFELGHPEVQPSFMRANLDGLPLSAIMYGARESAHAYDVMHEFLQGLVQRINENFETMEQHVNALLEVVNVFNGGSDERVDEVEHLMLLATTIGSSLSGEEANKLSEDVEKLQRDVNTGAARRLEVADPRVAARSPRSDAPRVGRAAAAIAAAASAAAESAESAAAASEHAEAAASGQTGGGARRHKRQRNPPSRGRSGGPAPAEDAAGGAAAGGDNATMLVGACLPMGD
jgi:hypothetical protein